VAAIWYLGVPGDLRALFCPERDMEMTELRFGGVHQSLGGARTMDVTGVKKQYTFNWKTLDESDYSWLRALHTRLIPGPHRLLDPMRKNRLSLGVSAGVTQPHKWPFYTASAGLLTNQTDYPAGVLGARGVRWSDRSASSTLALDLTKGTDVFALETVTVSAYLKGDSAVSVDMFVAWYDKTGAFLSNSSASTHSVTTSWARYSASKTAPANAVLGVFVITSTATTSISIAAPQFESGSSVTSWEEGGANPIVLIDQMTTTSPRYPVFDCTMVLLES
jgi:hypothetical protein